MTICGVKAWELLEISEVLKIFDFPVRSNHVSSAINTVRSYVNPEVSTIEAV